MFEQQELIAIQELINRAQLKGSEAEAVVNIKNKIASLILPQSEVSGTPEVEQNENKSGTEN